MIDTSRRAAALWTLMAVTICAAATPAFSQVSDAQRSAIRAQCRSDYEAHCASVPPGGAASLQCLQKNMSSLAPGCQSAVRAVEAAAEPKTEPKTDKADSKTEPAPAAEAPAAASPSKTDTATEKTAEKPADAATDKSAANPPAKKPSSTQIAAIRNACRADYQRTCAGVPTGGAAALNCLQKNKSKLSGSCQQAVNAAGGGAAAPAAGGSAATADPGAAPAAAPAAALVLRPMRPREVLFVLRSACGGDVRTLCSGIEPGGGRIAQCLAGQAASLSPACREVLAPFAAR
jgi:hypothetical protein